MKKTLLLASLFVGGLFTTNAQTTIWSDDFNDEDISDWTLIDADGDGLNWGDIPFVEDGSGNPSTAIGLVSRSWQGEPLTPDNWAISPAVDLTSASGTITLEWKVEAATNPLWNAEKYSVYVSTFDNIEDLGNSPISFTETYFGNGEQQTKTLDLSSFAGETIYIAFRHYDCEDQDYIVIDDVIVTAATASVNSPLAGSFSVYPNPAKDVLNISNSISAEINSITIADINGRTIKQFDANGSVDSQINIGDLNAGVYFVNIHSNEGSLTKKIVKQ